MSRDRKDKTKRLVISALMSALGVVFLYFGSLVEVMSISMAVIASVCVILAVTEFGGAYPWLIYAVTSTASILVLPRKEAAIAYILFFGFYPILKGRLEKKNKLLSWIFKELIFNCALAIDLLLSSLLLTAGNAEPLPIFIAYIVLAEIAFPLYDLALQRVVLMYMRKIRPKFKLK